MKRVVFVCVENSNRSQMAEAFARMHGAGRVEAFSAGSRPSGRVNPKAVEAMKELGYDLTTHTSKGLDELQRPGVRRRRDDGLRRRVPSGPRQTAARLADSRSPGTCRPNSSGKSGT